MLNVALRVLGLEVKVVIIKDFWARGHVVEMGNRYV